MLLSYFLEGMATLVISSFYIILTLSFFKHRLERKKEQVLYLSEKLNFDRTNAHITKSFETEYSRNDYWLPVIFVTTLTFLGFFLLLLGQTLYKHQCGEPIRSILWSGSDFWINSRFPVERKSLAVVAWALVGGFIQGGQYIFRRYITIDLTPGAFYHVGIRMVLSGVIATMLAFIVKPEPETTKESILALAFVAGLFPERALRSLLSRISTIFPDLWKRTKENIPLKDIEGLSYLHRLRLREVGIDNVQNLAFFDFIELTIKTPFPHRVLVDWISQAKLLMEFGEETSKLQQAGIRNALDFLDATSGNPARLKEVATLTGLDPVMLAINLENLEADKALAMLDEMRRGETDQTN